MELLGEGEVPSQKTAVQGSQGEFEVDGVKGADVEGVDLQRVTATGLAVRFARAA